MIKFSKYTICQKCVDTWPTHLSLIFWKTKLEEDNFSRIVFGCVSKGMFNLYICLWRIRSVHTFSLALICMVLLDTGFLSLWLTVNVNQTGSYSSRVKKCYSIQGKFRIFFIFIINHDYQITTKITLGEKKPTWSMKQENVCVGL